MQLFVENLTNIDFSYLDSTRGLVGETWLASITLEGDLDDQGMVCDFGVVKKTVRDWLDTHIDHCLLVAGKHPNLHYKLANHTIDLEWSYSQQHKIFCQSPESAITLASIDNIHPEAVATWCIDQLRQLLPDSIGTISLKFTPEAIDHHYYHYSHGLKKHRGNCQRIAHGHRSTIEIFRDNERDLQLELQWCQQWQDIYIGSESDLIKTVDIDGNKYHHFAYQAQQGDFELTLPVQACYLINTDSTVELIARHIANTLKQQNPINEFTVRAYEGIGKGAVAYS